MRSNFLQPAFSVVIETVVAFWDIRVAFRGHMNETGSLYTIEIIQSGLRCLVGF